MYLFISQLYHSQGQCGTYSQESGLISSLRLVLLTGEYQHCPIRSGLKFSEREVSKHQPRNCRRSCSQVLGWKNIGAICIPVEVTSAMKDAFLPTSVPCSISFSCITGYSVLSFVKFPYGLEGLVVSPKSPKSVWQCGVSAWTTSAPFSFPKTDL